MRLEDAIYQTVHRIGCAELAVKLSTRDKAESASTVSHKANPNDAAHYFRPRELVSMQVFTQDYAITHAMAEEVGGQFIEPAQFAHLSDEALLDLFASLMANCGAFAGDFRQAWSDGRLCGREFQALCDDLYQVKQVCAELQARMATMVDARPRVVALEKVRPGK